MAEWRNEAGRIRDWNGAYTLTYPQYLTLQGYERSMRTAFDDQTEQVNSSNRESLLALGDELQSTLTEGSEKIDQRLVSISHDVGEVRDEISSGFNGVTSALYWGFNIVSNGLTQIYGQLEDLIEITKSPTQTWSNERFKLALDAQKRRQFMDALTYADQAISGFGPNPGISTDWRYHYLRGDILLGNFRNHSAEIVNPAKAEKAFLKAASCARLDNTLMAGRSLIRAGRAAMIEGRHKVAYEHTKAGLVLMPDHAQGLYQAARLACVLGDPEAAKTQLSRALPINNSLYLSAKQEKDFSAFESVLPDATRLAAITSRKLYMIRRDLIVSYINNLDLLISDHRDAYKEYLDKVESIFSRLREFDKIAEGDFSNIERARTKLISLESEVLSLPRLAMKSFIDHAGKLSKIFRLEANIQREGSSYIVKKIQALENSGPSDDAQAKVWPRFITLIVLLGYICFIILIDFPKLQSGFLDDSEAIGKIVSWPISLWIIKALGSWASRAASRESEAMREIDFRNLRESSASYEEAAKEADLEAYKWEIQRDNAASKFTGDLAVGQIAKTGIIRDQS